MIDPRQEWRTPKDFWGVIDREFEFQLDAAASKENALCEMFLTKRVDALTSKWTGDWWSVYDEPLTRVYCNPGFSNLRPWMTKAYREAKRVPNALIAVMGLVSTSTKWWSFAETYAAEIRLLSPRVQFNPAPGVAKSSNARENCLVIFRRQPVEAPKARIWTWRWK